MGRPRSSTPTAPPSPADPLADLRLPEDLTAAGHVVTDVPEPEVEPRPTAPQALHDAMRAEVVAAYHADTVATGMLHKGGTCGCRYLATLALTTALGAPVEPLPELDAEDEDEGDGGETHGG